LKYLKTEDGANGALLRGNSTGGVCTWRDIGPPALVVVDLTENSWKLEVFVEVGGKAHHKTCECVNMGQIFHLIGLVEGISLTNSINVSFFLFFVCFMRHNS
jgi:hypothetical protein